MSLWVGLRNWALNGMVPACLCYLKLPIRDLADGGHYPLRVLQFEGDLHHSNGRMYEQAEFSSIAARHRKFFSSAQPSTAHHKGEAHGQSALSKVSRRAAAPAAVGGLVARPSAAARNSDMAFSHAFSSKPPMAPAMRLSIA